jgi:hypothetical protein
MNQAAIQQGVVTTLRAAPGLTSIVAGIYDRPPQGTDYPYVVIGDDTSIPFEADDMVGEECTLTIHVWSRQHGRAEAKLIMAQIYDALNRVAFDITDGYILDCMYDFSDTVREGDGTTVHGIIRFRIFAVLNS